MIQARTETLAGGKIMALGLLLAALVFGLALKPAHAATTFTVRSTGDQPDAFPNGVCDLDPRLAVFDCTLRAAIQEANRNPGADVIRFDIPDSFGSGVKTIDVGATGATTAGSGNVSFTFKRQTAVPAGLKVTATDPDGNTSEFSAPREVVRQR